MNEHTPLQAGLELLDYGVIGTYLLAVLWVGVRAARKQTGNREDYLLAGRGLTVPMFVATLVAAWYGGILGVGEFSYSYGVSQWIVFGLPYYIFAFIFALWLAPRVQASTSVSIPDRLEQIYGTRAGNLGAFFTFLMVNPAPYILMMAVLFELILGGGRVTGLLLGTVVSTLYLAHGGFRSVTATNYLEFIFMYAGFALILPFAYGKYGGMEFLSAHLPELHKTWHGGNSFSYILVWFFIAIWTLVDPGFHQRCRAARSPGVARNGILVSIGFWFIFDAMTVTTGLYARAALPDLSDASMAYPALAADVLPAGVKGIFYTGLLATVMSTLVSNAFLSGQTLGRDLIWRIRGGQEVRATQLGVLLSLLLALVLAWTIPSVVQLWYILGSAMVPTLLLPLVLTYATETPPSPKAAVGMMVGACLASTTWLVIGYAQAEASGPSWPLDLEPLYPGLIVSATIAALDRWAQHRTRTR